MNARALSAEFLGTFALVLVGCGAMMLAGPASPLATLAVASAFGLTLVTIAFALGHVSGGHFNPAVTVGLVAGGRFSATDAPLYIIAQLLGAIIAAGVLALLLSGAPAGQNVARLPDMAAISNHFGGRGEFGMPAAFAIELVMTALFVIVIMGATSKRAAAGFAPLAMGLALLAFHLASLPVTNTSLNPARSTAPALFAAFAGNARPMADLWLFWAAPIIGACIGGLIARWQQAE